MSWDSPHWKDAAREYHTHRVGRTLAVETSDTNGKVTHLRRKVERGVKKLEQTTRAAEAGFVDIGDDGKPKATLANAQLAIMKLGIICRYDAFRDKMTIGGHESIEQVNQLDNACLMLRTLIKEQFDFDPGRNHIQDAAYTLCLQNSFDPVVEYLAALKWDRNKRIDTWVTVYLGATDTPLNRAIGRLMLLAMVRRARQPGCKFDQIVVLEGPEGKNKSTVLLVLAGSPEFFSDQTIIGTSDQQQQERLRGKWVYEVADLAGLKRTEVEQVKAFASRTHDRARPAYGRAQVDLPRRGIIAATTNEHTYLRSQTGNRRFWPLATGNIDIDALRRDRDQLLAEAVALDDSGASLVLPEELWPQAAKEQEERLEYDPWLDRLADLKGTVFATERDGDVERISSDEILSVRLGIGIDKQTDSTTKRLGHAMRRLGWAGPERMRFGGGRGAPQKRGYWRHHRPDANEAER
jgi:predicted P-loop ATPase